MKKITIDEFFKNSDEILMAIRCDTEEKYNKLLKAFADKGHIRDSDIGNNHYDRYKDETCYANNNRCISINLLKICDCTIYDFEDVDLK